MDSSFFFYSSSFTFSTSSSAQKDPSGLPPSPVTIPIESPADPNNIRLTREAAALKIQSSYRSHLTRALVRRVAAADAASARLEALIRTQETVDAVRRDERERVRLGEALMALLLEMDGVPGFYPVVRDLRRTVVRRLVDLQEVLDAVSKETTEECHDRFPTSWQDVVSGTYCGGGGGGGPAAAAAGEVVEEDVVAGGREDKGWCFENVGVISCDYW